ncbi:MFS transporter [Arachidicoccus ginsenosidimutans]|nr:MFS transporter [Arachidicoccus sp. BS20]
MLGATVSKSDYKSIQLKIINYVLFTFLGYVCIGLPLAILPIFITKNLGYSALVAGVVISLQYATTFVTRGISGNMIDKYGPKLSVYISMICFMLNGILLYAVYLLRANPSLSLITLVVVRLITGCGEGFIGASPIAWAMMIVGQKHTATVISYNGIASYGALAVGAPLGVLLNEQFGLNAVSILILLIAVFGFFLATKKEKIVSAKQDNNASHVPFFSVLRKVAPYGICLMLAGLGFGTISNFITLYYDHFHWANAALCLSVFSILFIVGRLFFSNAINQHGGIKVALACLICETVGLFLLAIIHHPYFALLGASVTGFGFSLVFPALGVEAVKLFSAERSGAALAAYGLFIDISLGITGPLIGGVIEGFGIASMFTFCTGIVFIGLLLCASLNKKAAKVLAA